MAMAVTQQPNLPVSFDVTPLLCRVEHLENLEGAASVVRHERIRLIELEPYDYSYDAPAKRSTSEPEDADCAQRTQQQQQPTTTPAAGCRTRLFLAVAFGRRVVAVQLFALELGRGGDDRDDDDSNEIGPEEHADEEDEDLEWTDVSQDKVRPPVNEGSQGIDAAGTAVVVFPPSYAEPMSLSLSPPRGPVARDAPGRGTLVGAGVQAVDLTSCVLVPAPGLSKPGCRTVRAVALVLGTSCGRVVSLLLSVAALGGDEVRFALSYEGRRAVEDGGTNERKQDVVAAPCYPCVDQLLPRRRRLYPDDNSRGDVAARNSSSTDDDSSCLGDPFDDGTCTDDEVGDGRRKGQHSAITAISFCRDNLVAPAHGRERCGVVMSQDMLWIVYGDGTVATLPSWMPFLAAIGGGAESLDLVEDGATQMRALDDSSSVVPWHSPFRSPLELPPQLADQNQHLGASEGSDVGDYWDLLSSAVEGGRDFSSGRRAVRRDAEWALVLAGSASTSSIVFRSLTSSIAADCSEPPPPTSGEDEHPANASSDEENHSGPMTGAVVEGTAALVKGALGAALGAVRWGLASGVTDEGGEAAGRGQKRRDKFQKILAERGGHLDEKGTPPEGKFVEFDDTGGGGEATDRTAASAREQRREHHPTAEGLRDVLPDNREEAMRLPLWPTNGAFLSFSDVPRRFEAASVDPSGSVAAAVDNLGRVVLFDLETNTPVRMWKGMRNCRCYFSELPFCGSDGEKRLYLVIHLCQRGVVEAYRLRQGPRVAAIAVPQQKDFALVQCIVSSEGNRVETFLVERTAKPNRNRYVMDKLVIDDPDVGGATNTPNQMPTRPLSQRDNKMQLKLLLQLLSPGSNVQFTSQTVLATFKLINALEDLGEGLDALSKCDFLESHMGIDCSKLHLQAVSYFQSRLGHAKDTELREGSSMAQKSVISELSKLASYHDRLNRAYSVLHRYESTNGLNSLKEDSHNGEGTGTEKLSPWASESLLWISAASENEAQESRFMPSFSTVSSKEMSRPLTFSKFAMACQLRSGDSDQVYLTKKKQRRLPILRRIFNPLLKGKTSPTSLYWSHSMSSSRKSHFLPSDLFVFKVVYSLFCHLGIDEDFDMLQIYFGEWINNLPVSDLARSNMSDIWRPMVRWLHDLILNAFKVSKGEQHKLDGNLFRRAPMLESLIKFIKDMEDLPKAFLLAVICMEAVSSASLYLETKTYGTITQVRHYLHVHFISHIFITSYFSDK